MKIIVCLAGILLLFSNCNGKNQNQLDYHLPVIEDSSCFTKMKSLGVVIILPDSIEHLKKEMLIRDQNEIIVNRLFFDSEEKIVKFERNEIAIREYYPDYWIIIFDGYPIKDGKYKVFINDTIYFLEHVEGFTAFEEWETHIKRTFVSTDKFNPIRETPSNKGMIISDLDYENLNFVVLSVNDDWINIECDMYCEGCPDGQLVRGWVKWREGDKLLVKLYYAC